jgi:hypothetical protein
LGEARSLGSFAKPARKMDSNKPNATTMTIQITVKDPLPRDWEISMNHPELITARSLIFKFPIYLNKIYILQWFQPFIRNGQLSYLLAVLSTHQLFNRDRKFSKT